MTVIKGYYKVLTLKTLSKKASTGYDLMYSIKEISGKKPSPGTIYPLLEDLEKNKLIIKKIDGRKNIYTITKKGIKELTIIKKEKKEIFTKILNHITKLSGEDLTKIKQNLPNSKIEKSLIKLKFEVLEKIRKSKTEKNIIKILNEATKKIEKL